MSNPVELPFLEDASQGKFDGISAWMAFMGNDALSKKKNLPFLFFYTIKLKYEIEG